MTTELAPLGPSDKRDLAQCEKTIERGLASYVEVGTALMTIRDRLLYRDGHATFQDYCQKRWGFTRQRAHQLIAAVKPTLSGNEASTTVDIQPPNERVARELNKVPEEKREEVFNRAIIEAGNSQKVTSRQVREAAELLQEQDAAGDGAEESEESGEQPHVYERTRTTAEESSDHSFCGDLDALVERHRKHYGTAWYIIVSVLENKTEWARAQED